MFSGLVVNSGGEAARKGFYQTSRCLIQVSLVPRSSNLFVPLVLRKNY